MSIGEFSDVVIKPGGSLVLKKDCALFCSGGCGHGVCVAADSCKCDFGWTGPSCNTPAPACGLADSWKYTYSGGTGALLDRANWATNSTPGITSRVVVTSPVIPTKATVTASTQLHSLVISGEALVEISGAGVEVVLSNNCQPSCAQPCGNGNCTGFNTCTCHDGYYGATCTQTCTYPCVKCLDGTQCLKCDGAFRHSKSFYGYGWDNGVPRRYYAGATEPQYQGNNYNTGELTTPGWCCAGACDNLGREICAGDGQPCGGCAPGMYWDQYQGTNDTSKPCQRCPTSCGECSAWTKCTSCANGYSFFSTSESSVCCPDNCDGLHREPCSESGGQCGGCKEGYMHYPFSGQDGLYCISKATAGLCGSKGYLGPNGNCLCRPGWQGMMCSTPAPGVRMKTNNSTVLFGAKGDVKLQREGNTLSINTQLKLYRSLLISGDIMIGNPPVSLQAKVNALQARVMKLYDTFCPCGDDNND